MTLCEDAHEAFAKAVRAVEDNLAIADEARAAERGVPVGSVGGVDLCCPPIEAAPYKRSGKVA
eukprot:60843-Chlamydomonas_euryale.AAC.1